jgi:hypothetical protein
VARKAIVLKYDNKPESKEKKYLRQRKKQLAEYGLVEADYQAMLLRQQSQCAGCGAPVGQDKSACIDHCHKTGRIRGLLCNHCNWALGHARDDRSLLYQLAAYLELDRSKPVVYLVGSLRNPQIPVLGNEMRALGLEVVDNWFAGGKIADDAWQEYSVARGRSYAEALQSREAGHVFYFDRAYINLSDAVVMLYPAGRSAHLEFGYAVGGGKKGYLLMEEQPERYDVMLQFAGSTVPLFHDRQTFLKTVKQDLLLDG